LQTLVQIAAGSADRAPTKACGWPPSIQIATGSQPTRFAALFGCLSYTPLRQKPAHGESSNDCGLPNSAGYLAHQGIP
jgi:hypothetical protein